jgi:hypothetical protein
MLYHISLEKLSHEKLSPRIPKCRAQWENAEIPRICLSPSIEECLTGINENFAALLYKQDSLDIPLIGYIYAIDEKMIDSSNIISPNELYSNGYVFDSLITQEHWIINQDIKLGKPKIVRFVRMKAKMVSFNVKEEERKMEQIISVSYVNPIQDSEQDMAFRFANGNDLKRIKDIAENLGCSIKRFDFGEYFKLNIVIHPQTNIVPLWEEYKDIRLSYLKKFESAGFSETGL